MSVTFPSPEPGQDIMLAVRFVYAGAKADGIRRKTAWDITKPTSAIKIKADLDFLALMSPKSSHIVKSPVVPGAVELFYPTKFGSQHASQVEKKSRMVDKTLMAKRSVASIVLYYLPPNRTSIDPLFRPVYEVHSSDPQTFSPPPPHLPLKPIFNVPLGEKTSGQKRLAKSDPDNPHFFNPKKKQKTGETSKLSYGSLKEERDPVSELALKEVLQERDRLMEKVRQLEDKAHEDQQRERVLRDELEALKRNATNHEEQEMRLFDVSQRLERARETEWEVVRRLGRAVGRVPFAASAYDVLDIAERHIKDLEVRLELEAAAHRAAETRLVTERESHARAVQDIQRECREPFIVPALLDAFLNMSHMTMQIEVQA